MTPAGSRAASGIPAGFLLGLKACARGYRGRVSVISSVRGCACVRVLQRAGVVRTRVTAPLTVFSGLLRSARRPRGLQSGLPADGGARTTGLHPRKGRGEQGRQGWVGEEGEGAGGDGDGTGRGVREGEGGGAARGGRRRGGGRAPGP